MTKDEILKYAEILSSLGPEDCSKIIMIAAEKLPISLKHQALAVISKYILEDSEEMLQLSVRKETMAQTMARVSIDECSDEKTKKWLEKYMSRQWNGDKDDFEAMYDG